MNNKNENFARILGLFYPANSSKWNTSVKSKLYQNIENIK